MLSPDSAGDVQPDILIGFTLVGCTPGILASRGKLLVQGVECGMKAALGEPVLKGIRHLAFRLAPGTGKGHGQGLGDAEGGNRTGCLLRRSEPGKGRRQSHCSPAPVLSGPPWRPGVSYPGLCPNAVPLLWLVPKVQELAWFPGSVADAVVGVGSAVVCGVS